jgi:4-amino-4-deoxy-L-arabinose transferase-like glycosyltransferase
MERIDRRLVVILLVALAVRVAASVVRPLDDISDDGGFYINVVTQSLDSGLPFLAFQTEEGAIRHYTSIGPLYPAFQLQLFATLPRAGALAGLRAAQVLLDLLTVWLVYHIGRRLFGRGAGLVAMAAMALDVRFALQASDPSTETLYIALSIAGFYLYLRAVQSGRIRGFAGSGAVFGLATLTRPVPLLLPVAMALHALLAGKAERPRLLKGVGLMALALWALVTPWIVRNAVVTGGQFIPVSNVGASTFWLGSRDDGRYHGHEEFYEARAEDIARPDEEAETGKNLSPEYMRAGLANVLGKPLQYLGNRARNTLEAYLQPYGTVFFAGPSSRVATWRWLRGEASLGEGLATQGFWPKLAIYVFHFGALGLGLAGLALAWRRWRETLPLALMLVYGTGVYALLLVIPRYLFPLMPFYWVAAGFALMWLWERLAQRKAGPRSAPVPSGAEGR